MANFKNMLKTYQAKQVADLSAKPAVKPEVKPQVAPPVEKPVEISIEKPVFTIDPSYFNANAQEVETVPLAVTAQESNDFEHYRKKNKRKM